MISYSEYSHAEQNLSDMDEATYHIESLLELSRDNKKNYDWPFMTDVLEEWLGEIRDVVKRLEVIVLKGDAEELARANAEYERSV